MRTQRCRSLIFGRLGYLGRTLAALLLVLPPLSGQSLRKSAAVDSRVRELIDAAETLPLEPRADIELTIIESGRVPDGKLKRQLLQALFDQAPRAKYAYRENDALGDSTNRSVKVQAALELVSKIVFGHFDSSKLLKNIDTPEPR
jgi:hypothetical protein